MGRDKAALEWHGSTLIDLVAGVVLEAVGSVRIVGREYPPYESVPDRFPGFGPVGGIATALLHSRAEWTLIVACDMPGLDAAWLRSLIAAADGQVTVPRTPDRRIHPLCAVWHRTATDAMMHAVDTGTRAVRSAMSRLDVRLMDTENPTPLVNVNTPQDWAAWTKVAGTE
jgi:molybdopterin-guanine dinucleotide biosynthesis protein A